MRKSPSVQSGFTVIEVLVAVTISLILLLGVINIFTASRQSYTLQSGVARLQENARYALEIMSRSIALAGVEGADDTNVLPFGGATADGGGNTSDTIAVQYTSATDCLGDPSGVSGVAVDVFAITAGALTCNGTTIVDGVDNMQILYGQDDSTHPGSLAVQRAKGIADSYLSFDQVTLTNDQSDDGGITSVRIALLVSTVNDVNTLNDTNTYFLLDAPVIPAFNDRQIRRTFTRTVLLRNYYNRPKHPNY